MAIVKHVFVIGRSGQSVITRGPFASAEVAKEWIARHRPHAPCWLLPAEYAGLVPHVPLTLGKDGDPVQEPPQEG